MSVKIIAVGKLKERYLKDGCEEYIKRISGFDKIEVIELQDEKIPNNSSVQDEERIKKIEGEKILKNINDNDYVITLCIEGKTLSSENFASKIDELKTYGNSNQVFIIGGSLGISDEVKSISKFKLSFSPMTLPHHLMRLVLLEQIFRAYKINSNQVYHK